MEASTTRKSPVSPGAVALALLAATVVAVFLAMLFAPAWLYVVLALAAINLLRAIKQTAVDGLSATRLVVVVINALVIVATITWILAGA